eukprot:GHRQ01023743.1.p1 GENE.GHRQ01023743.1~~GHRQ01023743.1.p1  ORF type:complete len:147 (-),score=43.76 GHRQ01023743.1:2-442(-)
MIIRTSMGLLQAKPSTITAPPNIEVVLNAGCVSPISTAPNSPLRNNASDPESRMSLSMLRTSPIRERFQQAAVQQDLIAEPGSNSGSAAGITQQERPASADSNAAGVCEVAGAVADDGAAAAAAAAKQQCSLDSTVTRIAAVERVR